MLQLIITCEHASNSIPKPYQQYFSHALPILDSHRGLDIGAADVFNVLINMLNCYKLQGKYSRLLIELNRSLNAKDLFSSFTTQLSLLEKQRIIKTYYQPYIDEVQQQVEQGLFEKKRVLHLSIHSFTPVMNEVERKCDIGLLYDSRRVNEKSFCSDLKQMIISKNSELTVRKNYPYKGSADGLTTICRKKFGDNYMGIEIELNQKLLTDLQSRKKIGLFLGSCLQICLQKQA